MFLTVNQRNQLPDNDANHSPTLKIRSAVPIYSISPGSRQVHETNLHRFQLNTQTSSSRHHKQCREMASRMSTGRRLLWLFSIPNIPNSYPSLLFPSLFCETSGGEEQTQGLLSRLTLELSCTFTAFIIMQTAQARGWQWFFFFCPFVDNTAFIRG